LRFKEDSSRRHSDLESDRQLSRQTIQEQQSRISSLEEERSRLSIGLKESSQTSAHLRAQLQSFLQFLSSQSNALVRDLRSAPSVFADLCASVSSVNDKFAFQEEQFAALTERLRNSDRENEQLFSENKKLSKRIRRLESAADPGERSGERIAHEQRRHERTVAALEQTIERQRRKIEILEGSLKRLRKAPEAQPSLGDEPRVAKFVFEAEIERLTADVSGRDREIEELRGEIRRMEGDAAHLQSAFEQCGRENAKLRNAVERRKREIERQREALCEEAAKYEEALSALKDREAQLADQGTTIHELQLAVGRLKRGKVQTVPVGESEISKSFSLHRVKICRGRSDRKCIFRQRSPHWMIF
jgi:chromosome segregation ATPase